MPSVQIRNVVIKRVLFFFFFFYWWGGGGVSISYIIAGCAVATGNVLRDVKQFAKANLPFLKKV